MLDFDAFGGFTGMLAIDLPLAVGGCVVGLALVPFAGTDPTVTPFGRGVLAACLGSGWAGRVATGADLEGVVSESSTSKPPIFGASELLDPPHPLATNARRTIPARVI